ncbi:MFS transporter [Kineosporia rhizophila]|uniref:MFS transporter n=1 Tax=Kineosporia TaxID=49184 RepID=UPI001E48C48F|nr:MULTISPECIES: MFS transporter [Kineosporia]MCE0534987.1 MFS transporter [Kineosporia rhizophila]GLY14729.1 MFS transporter [Kineosporia sp. NBRC 101677]
MTSVDSVGQVPAESTAEQPAASDPRRWWALAVIAVAQLMVVLDASIVNIALPSAQADLNISDANRQWVLTAYALAFGALLLLGGRIADYTGRKRIFLIGLIGFAGASALGGAAVNDLMLFGARGLQGLFAALLAPAALSLLQVSFTDAKERARAFGVYGAVSGTGAAIGLILGGVLTEYLNWRWTLLVNVPIAILAAVAAVSVVRESKAHGDTRYDVPGAVLVSGGLAALVYGFTQAAEAADGWSATSTITWLVVSAVLLVGFVVWETRTHHPLLPLRVVLDRNRGAAFASSLLIGAGLFAMFLFLTYYFQQNLGYSAIKSGFAFLPFSAGIIVAATVASSLMPKVNPRVLLVVGGAMATGGLALLTQIEADSSWLTLVLPAEILISLGMGLYFVVSASVALAGVEEHDAGVASAMLNTSQQIGGALGIALLNTFFASTVTDWLAEHMGSGSPEQLAAQASIQGYHVAFWIGAGFIGAATLIVLALVNARSKDLSTEGMVHAG